MEPSFAGEHLRPGHLGHLLAILSFVGALLSAFSYFRSAQTELKDPAASRSWLSLGRSSFIVHGLSVLGIFVTLYYILTHHLFEYHYAWSHSDRSLNFKYLLSCFWEGQEGSFLLWTFWHAVLGGVVIWRAKALESRSMAVVSLVQVLLATMVLGFYFGTEVKVGSSPFALLRNVMQNAPIFSQPDYLDFVKDGNGLNQLLQNYWMTIHPPILFLGFSATLFPFAFAIAALWKGDMKSWVKPALQWSLFAGGVLGLGIMMGGAWAYESLTFGGYWAWDPVENASLVPWLTLVAGLHTLVVYKSTGRSLVITLILLLLTYLFVWYSTFLTRTGILGDTSVHAFTGEGKSLHWHLLLVIAVLFGLSAGLLAKRWKSLPRVKTEEQVSSREFWIFIGSFVLLLSSLHIIIRTSLPVWSPLVEKITGKKPAPTGNVVAEYNSVQVWVAIITGLLTGAILFLKFKKTDGLTALKRLGLVAGLSAGLTALIAITQKITPAQYILMTFAASFTLVGMVYYATVIQRGAFLKRGAPITHFGFGLMLLGILLSSYNKEVISLNITGNIMDFGKKTMAENVQESQENALLYRGVPVAMGNYYATYVGDSTAPNDKRIFYNVHYERRDSATGKVQESFLLHPDLFVNNKGGENSISANPDSKHYLTKDVFTYLSTSINKKTLLDSIPYNNRAVRPGDRIPIMAGYVVVDSIGAMSSNRYFEPVDREVAVGAYLSVFDSSNALIGRMTPVFAMRTQQVEQFDDTLSRAGLYARFNMVVEDSTVKTELGLRQLDPGNDYIVMKALVFPYINLLWTGTIIMTLGFLLSLINRSVQRKKLPVLSMDKETEVSTEGDA